MKEAKAAVSCRVVRHGLLEDCRVVRETPENLGVGEAALRTASTLALSAWTDDGRPVDGRRVVIPLTLRDEEPSPAGGD